MHITGDIAFAARQYVAATGDQNWLKAEMGGDLIYETARFWASRAVYSASKQQYEILSKSTISIGFNSNSDCFHTIVVLPPDEDAQPFKNNSVFTNAVASFSIELANSVSCVTQKSVPQTWLEIARNLHFPFDTTAQIHLEYENFNPSTYMT